MYIKRYRLGPCSAAVTLWGNITGGELPTDAEQTPTEVDVSQHRGAEAAGLCCRETPAGSPALWHTAAATTSQVLHSKLDLVTKKHKTTIKKHKTTKKKDKNNLKDTQNNYKETKDDYKETQNNWKRHKINLKETQNN